ncbi:hypothetical protein [Spongiactinospora rosea]|uniref:hypothetical protein n=1 Tax=Spongiactinospora rosea TaxID=2248750 RepID=UPI0011C06FBF|nr:hypothetical protein [Spongiactinospora rosea]
MEKIGAAAAVREGNTVAYDEADIRIRTRVVTPRGVETPEAEGATDFIQYGYDAVSRRTSYWDNGWSKTPTTRGGIKTAYDYNTLGLQTKRTSPPRAAPAGVCRNGPTAAESGCGARR